MEEEIDITEIIKQQNVPLFKAKKFFNHFREVLMENHQKNDKLIKIYKITQKKYNFIKSKQSNYWKIIKESLFSNSQSLYFESSLLEYKYLKFFAFKILKYLAQISTKYSISIDILKQKYVLLCADKLQINLINNEQKQNLNESINQINLQKNQKFLTPVERISDNEKKHNRLLKIRFGQKLKLTDTKIKKFSMKKNKENRNNNNNEKLLNNLDYELLKLNTMLPKDTVDDFIGEIDIDTLFKKSRDISFKYMLLTKKNKIFETYINKNKNFTIDANNIESEMNYNNIYYILHKNQNQKKENSKTQICINDNFPSIKKNCIGNKSENKNSNINTCRENYGHKRLSIIKKENKKKLFNNVKMMYNTDRKTKITSTLNRNRVAKNWKNLFGNMIPKKYFIIGNDLFY